MAKPNPELYDRGGGGKYYKIHGGIIMVCWLTRTWSCRVKGFELTRLMTPLTVSQLVADDSRLMTTAMKE